MKLKVIKEVCFVSNSCKYLYQTKLVPKRKTVTRYKTCNLIINCRYHCMLGNSFSDTVTLCAQRSAPMRQKEDKEVLFLTTLTQFKCARCLESTTAIIYPASSTMQMIQATSRCKALLRKAKTCPGRIIKTDITCDLPEKVGLF